MKIDNNLTEIVHQLRQNRQESGLKPADIDQDAYLYESKANLARLNPAQLKQAVASHYNAVREAADRKVADTFSRQATA